MKKTDGEALQFLLEQLTGGLQNARNILKAHDEMIKLQVQLIKNLDERIDESLKDFEQRIDILEHKCMTEGQREDI